MTTKNRTIKKQNSIKIKQISRIQKAQRIQKNAQKIKITTMMKNLKMSIIQLKFNHDYLLTIIISLDFTDSRDVYYTIIKYQAY